ncbi:uncharacterized protein LOC130871403 [Chionomys nivalis]|uniref:uncharacterized protein LOC130871403 n=1 Tax=Chionomys nivalis TaxID=269649 RepID=UPI00259400D9|nr:uncharacterized protein LOC130871403 [Chionomys nivalis]
MQAAGVVSTKEAEEEDLEFRRTPTNKPEPQSVDVRTIRECNPGASSNPSSAPSGLRKLGFIPPTPTNGGDPARCPCPRNDNASSCAYLGAPAATRTRHPFASSRSDRPGNEDAAPFPARRCPKPVSALRVRASHTIYDQKTEGGADPVSQASACAPEAEPSRAEPGGAESRGAEPNGAETRGAELRGALPRRAELSRMELSARRAQRPESEQKGPAQRPAQEGR